MGLLITLFCIAFFWLLVGHAVSEFALQSDAMAKGKNFNSEPGPVPWYYWMASHSLIHAGAVTLITGSIFLGIMELVLHFAADCAKCAGYTSIHVDQFFHVICKLCWAYLAAQDGVAYVSNERGSTGG